MRHAREGQDWRLQGVLRGQRRKQVRGQQPTAASTASLPPAGPLDVWSFQSMDGPAEEGRVSWPRARQEARLEKGLCGQW